MLSAWDAHVHDRPDAPAVLYFDAELSFAVVDRTAEALACWLRDCGVRARDRVAVYLQNDPQWLVVMLASWKVGVIPVAVNPMLRRKELTHQLEDSGAVVLVCLDHLYGDVAEEVLPHTQVRHVLTTHPLDMTCVSRWRSPATCPVAGVSVMSPTGARWSGGTTAAGSCRPWSGRTTSGC
jgi:long-chain acyl-CoA synthetase